MESMVVAAFVNREGISTIRENGARYTVDQRNIFIFQNANWEKLNGLFDKKYYIPSIDGHTRGERKLDFNIVELREES